MAPVGDLVRLNVPLHAKRAELADQLLREAIAMYMIDLSYTPDMVIAILGPMIKSVGEATK